MLCARHLLVAVVFLVTLSSLFLIDTWRCVGVGDVLGGFLVVLMTAAVCAVVQNLFLPSM